MNFFTLEVIQFILGLALVLGIYFLIAYYRRLLLDYSFGGEEEIQAKRAFKPLTTIGYFLIFSPLLLFGIDVAPPVNYTIGGHVQRIIYYEAGIVLLIGILHFIIMGLSSKVRF
jgi:hypothetical protein